MRPRGTREELEIRRRKAVAMYQSGMSTREVAKVVGCAPSAVSTWNRQYEEEGDDGLNPIPSTPRTSAFGPKERRKLAGILKKGARASGFSTELWTIGRVVQVVKRKFGLEYSVSRMHTILREMGFSYQKPERRAREQDQREVERFRKETWAQAKKKARKKGLTILLLDESGFMLEPLVQKTWAPIGQTPILDVPGRRDKVSSITGLTVSPRQRRIGMYFSVQDENVTAQDAMDYIRWVRRQVGNKLLVILDRAGIHRSAARQLRERGDYEFLWFPPYSPHVDPVEFVWGSGKKRTANAQRDDKDELFDDVCDNLDDIGSNQQLLRSFFNHAGLPL